MAKNRQQTDQKVRYLVQRAPAKWKVVESGFTVEEVEGVDFQ